MPSSFFMSIARPRLTWAGVIRWGLPSTTSYPTFIAGIDLSARTRAKPIRWVKETLPPRARARWLLMTIRLSHSSLTGTERTLVAVGTVRLSSMFFTVRAGAPLSTVNCGSSTVSAPACFSASFEVGLSFAEGLSFVEGLSLLVAALLVAPLPLFFSWDCTLWDFSAFCSVDSVLFVVADFVRVPAAGRLFGAPVDSVTEPLALLPLPAPAPGGVAVTAPVSRGFSETSRWSLPKKSHQTLSTLSGSFWYRSYISSTSHSLAPNPDMELSSVGSGTTSFASSSTRQFSVRLKARPLDGGTAGEEGQSLGLSPVGASGRIRTCDTWYRKPVLYPLSYGGMRERRRPEQYRAILARCQPEPADRLTG